MFLERYRKGIQTGRNQTYHSESVFGDALRRFRSLYWSELQLRRNLPPSTTAPKKAARPLEAVRTLLNEPHRIVQVTLAQLMRFGVVHPDRIKECTERLTNSGYMPLGNTPAEEDPP